MLRYFFFYQNIGYNVQTNKLQFTKINQNNVIVKLISCTCLKKTIVDIRKT